MPRDDVLRRARTRMRLRDISRADANIRSSGSPLSHAYRLALAVRARRAAAGAVRSLLSSPVEALHAWLPPRLPVPRCAGHCLDRGLCFADGSGSARGRRTQPLSRHRAGAQPERRRDHDHTMDRADSWRRRRLVRALLRTRVTARAAGSSRSRVGFSHQL